jgi:DNA repair exonuclease SbcCD ATPase subunit
MATTNDESAKRRLYKIRVKEISLVDKPAIEREFSIIKRADGTPGPVRKKGAKMSAVRLEQLTATYEAIGKLILELTDTDSNDEVEKMDLSEITAKVEALEKKLETLDEIQKRLDEAKAEAETLQKKIDDLEAAAKTETETVEKRKTEADEKAGEVSGKLDNLEKRSAKADEDAVAVWAEIDGAKVELEKLQGEIVAVSKKLDEHAEPAISRTGTEATGEEVVEKSGAELASFKNILGK